jgi:hypothetical protein
MVGIEPGVEEDEALLVLHEVDRERDARCGIAEQLDLER